MAKLSDIVLRVDEFFTDTRVRACLAVNCKYNTLKIEEELGCNLKNIEIIESGVCKSFERKEE